jgi:hypothetical protein
MGFLPAPEDRVAASLDGRPATEERPPIPFVSPDAAAAGTTPGSHAFPDALSPLAGLVAATGEQAGRIADAVGTVDRPRSRDFALDDAQRALLATLRTAAADASRAQLLAIALLVDRDVELRAQQHKVIVEAYGGEALPIVDDLHRHILQLPPGARQPLADIAMPALRKLSDDARQRLLRVAHMLIVADGRVSVPEFLLFTILKRRLGPDAGRAAPVTHRSIDALPKEAGLVLSLAAAVRLPDRAEHAFNAGALLLPGVDAPFTPSEAIRLDAVSEALDRLNGLAPLAKPQLIKAVTATVYADDATNWRAASTLRMICAALDAPLPPKLLATETG